MKRSKLYVDDAFERSAMIFDVEIMFLGGGMGALVEGMGCRTPVA